MEVITIHNKIILTSKFRLHKRKIKCLGVLKRFGTTKMGKMHLQRENEI